MGILEKYNKEYLAELAFFGEINFTNEEQKELIEVLKRIILDNDKINCDDDRTIMILALVCIIRKWQGSDKNFWEYILNKLDLKINYIIFYNPITEYLNSTNRKIYKSYEKKSSYYSTLFAQALGPKESMFALFDLLFSIYDESLLRDYKQHDDVFKKIALNLKHKMHREDDNSDDIDFQIGSVIYKFKSSIRMMIDQDNERFASLIDRIMFIFNENIYNDQSNYLQLLVREWNERNKNKIETNRTKRSLQQDFEYWKPKYIFENNRVKIEIPNLRISNYSEFKIFTYRLFINGSIISGSLAVGGNELLKYIKAINLDIDENKLNSNSDIRVNLQFLADGKKFFDSDLSLNRQFIIFNNNRETFKELLETKRYTLFSTYEDELDEKNLDYLSRYFYSLYINKDSLFEFRGKLFACELSCEENKENLFTFLLGDKIPNLKYCYKGTDQEIDIYEYIPILKFKNIGDLDKKITINILQSVLLGDSKEFSCQITVNNENNQLEISKIVENIPSVLRISIIESLSGKRLKVISIFVKKFSFENQNKVIYGIDSALNYKGIKYRFTVEEKAIVLPYKDGVLRYVPKYILWSFLDYTQQNKLFSGYFWHSDIPVNSILKIETNFESKLLVKIASIEKELIDNQISITYLLDSLDSYDRNLESLFVSIVAEDIEYRLFEIKLNEKFEGNPYIQLTEYGVLYDFSQVYVGSLNSKFRLELLNDIKTYSLSVNLFGLLNDSNIIDGNYMVNIYKLSENVFDFSEKHLYSGEIIIGDPMKFIFENTKIRLKKCVIKNKNNDKSRIDNHIVELFKSDNISELGFPVYKGVLDSGKRKDDVIVEVYNRAKLNIKKKKSDNYFEFNYNIRTKSLSLDRGNNKDVFEIESIYFELEKEY